MIVPLDRHEMIHRAPPELRRIGFERPGSTIVFGNFDDG
jgi:hypothetical protein